MRNVPMMRNNDSFLDLRREIDRLFEDFWSTPTLLANAAASPVWAPAVEFDEEDNHYLLTMEVPGISRDDLKIEFVNGQITISGERKQKEKNGKYSERRYGKFYRSFTLPNEVDADRVEAQYQDGVLRVYVPKAETAKPRQIKIGDASSGGIFSRLLGHKESDRKTVEHKKEEKVA